MKAMVEGIVSGESWTVVAASGEQARLWYVRNAAKANRKPCAPAFNETNASSLSGARGKPARGDSSNT